MAAPVPDCAPGGSGVDILGYCLTSDPFLEAILYALPLIFAFFAAALTGAKWRERIRVWLYGATWSRAYAGLLRSLLGYLDQIFGPPVSWKSMAVVLVIALGYSYLFPVWQSTLLERFYDAPTFQHDLLNKLQQLVLPIIAALALVVFLALLIASVFVGRSRRVIRDASYMLLLPVFTVGYLLVYPDAISEGLQAVREGGIELYIFLLILMPLLNALFDWPSWIASRWLMNRLEADALKPGAIRRAALLIFHAVIDIALAIICLFGLAILVANGTHLLGLTDIWIGFRQADATPLSSMGAVMTVMLLSTLVPTFLHLFFALFALAVIRPPYAARTAYWMQEDTEGQEIGTQIIVALYLTACAGFALIALWGIARLVVMGLDRIAGPNGIWPQIFLTAERFVIF